MSVLTLVSMLAVAVGIGAIGFVVGMLVAPLIGRWAERITEGDDDE